MTDKDENLDLDADGRIYEGDGYQYEIELANGQRRWRRDHDPIANVTARLATMQKADLETAKANPHALQSRFWFSGAKGRETRVQIDEKGEPVNDPQTGEPATEEVPGPLRGKGWHYASHVVGISYSADGEPAPATEEAAYAAAVAYLNAQRRALEAVGAGLQQQEQGQETGAGPSDAEATAALR